MKKLIIFYSIASGLLFYSCKKDWFVIKPKGEADITTFANKNGVDALLLGVYAAVDGAPTGAEVEAYASAVSNWLWGSVQADDAYKGASPSSQPPMNGIEQHTLEPSNIYLGNHWKNLFDGVSRANDVLKLLPLVEDMTDAEKKQIEAQAKFLRAHFNFELTVVHGKIPYIDENTENPSAVRNDHILWPEIEADLKFASENLPSRFTHKGRATKWAAMTYLGRVLMFQNKFSEARPILEDVYLHGGYTLMPSYEQNYLIAFNNNQESIFEIQYVVDGFSRAPNAGIGDAAIAPATNAGMGTCCGYFQPTHSLVSAHRVDNNGLPLLDDTYSADDVLPYDPNGLTVPYTDPVDPRLDHTVGRPGVPYLDWGPHKGHIWIGNVSNGGPYLYKKSMFRKDEKGLANSTSWAGGLNPNNFRKFRLGHVILWLAECEAEVGSLQTATNLVNEIRNRAKNSNVVEFDNGDPAANYKVEPYPDVFPSKEFARKAIRHEIRIEFAMEGLRFFDLVRWGVAAETLNHYLDVEGTMMAHLQGKEFIAGQHEYAPIPQREIDLSVVDGESSLTQNNGY